MTKFSRREFLKITASAAGGLALMGTAACHSVPRPATYSASKFLLGTVINLTVVAPDEAAGQEAVHRTFGEIERLTQIFSRFEATSQLSQLNQHGVLVNPAPELRAVLARALYWSEMTGGAFDVTVQPVLALYEQAYAQQTLPAPAAVAHALTRVGYQQVRVEAQRITLLQPEMSLTLDGIAKGYIIDACVRFLNNLGYRQVLVEAGGDLYAQGQKPAQKWQVGIKSPSSGGITARFELADRGAATSGDYQQAFTADRQAHHILDPRTGYSPLEVSSATVLAPNALEADALATAALVLGVEAGLQLVNGLTNFALYLITKSGQVAHTNNFPV